MQHISAIQLKAWLDSTHDKPLILDVREPWEYDICKLDDSLLIPMREVPARAAELDPDSDIVVLCHHGIRSQQVAYFLEHAGFNKLHNVLGGIEAWAKDVDPGMAQY